ncbi:MAG: copper amine oxidase N-terminal domain-containing protein [Clostridia bacterium]|nr:copper amine oxidase N-terminal domain-containing protein [Clostridia bacterium]
MKKIKKIIVCIVIASMLASVFAGCSAADRVNLLNALEKNLTIRSMESKSDVTLKIGLEGLPEEEQQMLQPLLAGLGNIKIQTHQKTIQNKEKTITQAQIDGAVQVEDLKMNSSMWLSSDISGPKPTTTQIVRLPIVLRQNLPGEFAGKEYMVVDQLEIADEEGTTPEDYNKMMELMNNLEPKLLNFLKDYAMHFDPGFAFITHKDDRVVDGEHLTVYELRLDDAKFKSLMRYALTSFAHSKEAKNLIKELINTMIAVSGDTEAGEDLEKAFDELRDGSTEFLEDVNKVARAFKNVRLLGDRGIVINFAINEEGYIVNQNGVMDILLDFQAIDKALEKLDDGNGTAVEGIPTPPGVLKLSIDFNTDIYNINEYIKIDFPHLNEQNSFKFSELMAATTEFEEIPEDMGYEGDKPIDVVVNGEKLELELPPIELEEAVLLPISDIALKLGADVGWDKSGVVTVVKNGATIIYKTDSADVQINGQSKTMEYPAIIIDSKMYVPLSSIAEGLGADMNFDVSTRTLVITGS